MGRRDANAAGAAGANNRAKSQALGSNAAAVARKTRPVVQNKATAATSAAASAAVGKGAINKQTGS